MTLRSTYRFSIFEEDFVLSLITNAFVSRAAGIYRCWKFTTALEPTTIIRKVANMTKMVDTRDCYRIACCVLDVWWTLIEILNQTCAPGLKHTYTWQVRPTYITMIGINTYAICTCFNKNNIIANKYIQK